MTRIHLDFDTPRLPRDIEERITMRCTLWQWPLECLWIRKTRRGWHVGVWVRKRIEPAMIVAAQAILGGDPTREAYNLMRVQSLDVQSPFWRKRWNSFYARHYHNGARQ